MDSLEVIKSLCDKNGISIAQLEKELGYGNGSIAKARTIKSDRVVELSEYFGVSTDYILKGGENTLQRVELDSDTVKIKVLGRVAAGVPIEAVEEIIGEETISRKMANSGEYFGLRISGDSMEPTIHHGSIVIVRQQDDVENGEIAIVIVNGNDATCKRIEKFDNGIMLVPINTEYEEKFYSNEEIESLPVKIIGKVVQARTNF